MNQSIQQHQSDGIRLSLIHAVPRMHKWSACSVTAEEVILALTYNDQDVFSRPIAVPCVLATCCILFDDDEGQKDTYGCDCIGIVDSSLEEIRCPVNGHDW